MEHISATKRITEYVSGELSPEVAHEIERHLEECVECRRVVETLREMQEAGRSYPPALFDPHPDADELARYVFADPSISTIRLAGIGDHVRGCPTCATEEALTRRADAEARSWRSRLASAWSPGARWWIPVPALAAALIALFAITLTSFQALRSGAGGRGWAGGAAPVAYIAADVRSTASIEIRRNGQHPYQVILVEADWQRFLDRDGATIHVRIDGPDSRPTWSLDAELSSILDPSLGVVSLLVPSTSLPIGDSVLRIRDPDGVERRFRVRVSE